MKKTKMFLGKEELFLTHELKALHSAHEYAHLNTTMHKEEQWESYSKFDSLIEQKKQEMKKELG